MQSMLLCMLFRRRNSSFVILIEIVWLPGGAQNTFVGQAMSMFGIVLVLLLASRAVFVFPIMALHNLWSAEKLPLRQIVVAWCACVAHDAGPGGSTTKSTQRQHRSLTAPYCACAWLQVVGPIKCWMIAYDMWHWEFTQSRGCRVKCRAPAYQ